MFESILNYGLDTLLPLKSKLNISNDPPWISQSLKKLIQHRQNALARGNETLFKSLRNQVNRERKLCRSKFYSSKVEYLKSCSSAEWWKETKKLSGISPQVRVDPISLLRNLNCGSESKSIQLEDLANTINKTFLEPTKDFEALRPETGGDDVPIENTQPYHVSETSVSKKLAALIKTKVTGSDGIPAWLLKENSDILGAPISDILNCSYQEASLPQSWKCADIIPIPKQKPVQSVNRDLRPISLTPIISKVVEYYIVDEFVKPAVLRKVDPNQYGAIPRSSPVFALLSMIHKWNAATDGTGATVRVVLFDFKKAFDLVDHHLLLSKLNTYDLPQWVFKWIKDFFTGRKQRVKLNQNSYSDWEDISAGVPQGTKLGPWLFIIIINDREINDSNIWKFVDDITFDETVRKNEESNIQTIVDDLSKQISEAKFKLNETKCKELRIGFCKPRAMFDPITVNGKSLEVVDSAKILGLSISSNLKWNNHIDQIISKARKRLYSLSQLKRANVGMKELVLFFTTCIRPILEYASPVFHNSLTNYLSQDLERIQKRALRIILPWTSYEEALQSTGLERLSHRRDILSNKLFDAIITDDNHKLFTLLPPCNETVNMTLRSSHRFNVTFQTNRFKNSFIIHNALNYSM